MGGGGDGDGGSACAHELDETKVKVLIITIRASLRWATHPRVKGTLVKQKLLVVGFAVNQDAGLIWNAGRA